MAPQGIKLARIEDDGVYARERLMFVVLKLDEKRRDRRMTYIIQNLTSSRTRFYLSLALTSFLAACQQDDTTSTSNALKDGIQANGVNIAYQEKQNKRADSLERERLASAERKAQLDAQVQLKRAEAEDLTREANNANQVAIEKIRSDTSITNTNTMASAQKSSSLTSGMTNVLSTVGGTLLSGNAQKAVAKEQAEAMKEQAKENAKAQLDMARVQAMMSWNEKRQQAERAAAQNNLTQLEKAKAEIAKRRQELAAAGTYQKKLAELDATLKEYKDISPNKLTEAQQKEIARLNNEKVSLDKSVGVYLPALQEGTFELGSAHERLNKLAKSLDDEIIKNNQTLEDLEQVAPSVNASTVNQIVNQAIDPTRDISSTPTTSATSSTTGIPIAKAPAATQSSPPPKEAQGGGTSNAQPPAGRREVAKNDVSAPAIAFLCENDAFCATDGGTLNQDLNEEWTEIRNIAEQYESLEQKGDVSQSSIAAMNMKIIARQEALKSRFKTLRQQADMDQAGEEYKNTINLTESAFMGALKDLNDAPQLFLNRYKNSKDLKGFYAAAKSHMEFKGGIVSYKHSPSSSPDTASTVGPDLLNNLAFHSSQPSVNGSDRTFNSSLVWQPNSEGVAEDLSGGATPFPNCIPGNCT